MGEEALARAKREDKPIFLSVGYAACHWCHVMERESFEHEPIAALLNRDFVCIKVDREERPDLDEIYMAATVALAGSGGWPMSVFLDPEQRPFYAGTYFPPSDRWGRPGFPSVLERIAELWRTRRDDLLEQASELTRHVRAQFEESAPGAVSSELSAAAARELARTFDPRWGGFTSAPKFPPSAALGLLLRRHARTGDASALGMVTRTLDAMKDGGIYDQLGGGFARYSTDERCLVPHFEKMLYDNAELGKRTWPPFRSRTTPSTGAHGDRDSSTTCCARCKARTAATFPRRDADSEGVEGKYSRLLVGRGAGRSRSRERRSVRVFLRRDSGGELGRGTQRAAPVPTKCPRRPERSAPRPRRSSGPCRRRARRSFSSRNTRVPPLLDDKVIAAWNGLMIDAMARRVPCAARSALLRLGRACCPRYVLERLRRPDGGLYRTARGERAHLDAYLEDYAFVADALVTLYEAGAAETFLHEALTLAQRMIRDFGREPGAFFATAERHETLVARPRESHDGALPSANAVAARVLARLARHFDQSELAERARQAIEAYGALMQRAPRAFATSLGAIELLEATPLELAVVGTPGSAEREALEEALAARYLPFRINAHQDPSGGPSALPLLAEKTLVDGRAALYVCRNFTCKAPITNAAEVAGALDAS